VTRGSKLMLYVLVGGPIAVGLFVLLLLGPQGWVLAAFLVLGAMVVRSFSASDEDGGPERKSCSACGAPNAVDRETCRHCGGRL
jgi:hypothetical protein